jgi:hypothetical protein
MTAVGQLDDLGLAGQPKAGREGTFGHSSWRVSRGQTSSYRTPASFNVSKTGHFGLNQGPSDFCQPSRHLSRQLGSRLPHDVPRPRRHPGRGHLSLVFFLDPIRLVSVL